MEHWKTVIEAGNRCFTEGNWVQARELYLQALAEAQVLLGRWADHEQAVAAFVVSHHNLADLHLTLEQAESAAENLCACHERLLSILGNGALPEALQQAALRHSQRTYLELLQFIAEYGTFPRTDRLLGAARRHACTPHPSCSCGPGPVYH
ncbi:hypothetical protein OU800_19365 [Pseudomonas sp. GOM7]|uniref:hypothetical protein n=1 Tax=unclassified Pseudomonas TaxID=196821 RepID=UPI00227AEE2A|nr:MULTISPECIES: hypothetical protein [unclassified Pseudomonas]WAJ36749.1 hypothetical protein OU800_19365 [Pseudomonas sp. GOM7]